MKLLFISRTVNVREFTGVSVATRSQYQIVQSIVGIQNCYLYNVVHERKGLCAKLINFAIYKRYAGMSIPEENKIIHQIKSEGFDMVYLDSSLWGFLAERIKKETPVRLYVFCQDIETHRLRTIIVNHLRNLQLKSFFLTIMLLLLAHVNEKRAVIYADSVFNFSSRDATIMHSKYGRKSTEIIPLFISDKDPDFSAKPKQIYDEGYMSLLFVGVGNYEPNVSGVKWFAKEVLPFIDARLYIVGRGTEKLEDEFKKITDKVRIMGEVSSLDGYYIDADAVVVPLFSGGGMKVKTLEALMYGKTIFGTEEAFQGFELDFQRVGGICNDSQDFIEQLSKCKPQKYNEYSRNVFLKKYCVHAVRDKFSRILE